MTSVLRALTGALGTRRGTRGDGQSAPRDEEARHTLALPQFLEVSKTLTLTHAEISALYFVVEECLFRVGDRRRRSGRPARRGMQPRAQTRSDPALERRRAHGIYPDLIELPWES